MQSCFQIISTAEVPARNLTKTFSLKPKVKTQCPKRISDERAWNLTKVPLEEFRSKRLESGQSGCG